jgi:signal transduction histidine kinase
MRLPSWLRGAAGDRALALVLLATSVAEVLTAEHLRGPLGLNLLAVATLTIPLAWRRRWPLAVLGFTMAAGTIQGLYLSSVDDVATIFFVVIVLSYTAGAHLPRHRAWFALPLMFLGICGVNLGTETATTSDYLFPSAVVLIAWLCGRAVRARALLTEELHEAAIRAEEAHEADAQRAMAEERRRIAREMHDVVAHSVSVMVVQAGGARRIIDRDPDRAAQAAAQIEYAGRAALVEMRRLLGLLHGGEGEAGALAPQPSLAELDALVERSRAAGLPVEVRVLGERRPVPAGIDLAAYRIVQEALTNTLKHAGAAPTEVHLRWGEDELELEILDRGRLVVPDSRNGSGGGHGLVGMAERVRLYGGELEAGPRPAGGFRVRARLPLEERERVSV